MNNGRPGDTGIPPWRDKTPGLRWCELSVQGLGNQGPLDLVGLCWTFFFKKAKKRRVANFNDFQSIPINSNHFLRFMSSVTRSGKSMRVRCRTGKPPHWPSRIDTKRNAVPGRRMDSRAGRPRFAVVRGCGSGRFRACWRLGAQRLVARARPAPPGAGGVPNCRWFPVISNQFQSIPITFEKI